MAESKDLDLRDALPSEHPITGVWLTRSRDTSTTLFMIGCPTRIILESSIGQSGRRQAMGSLLWRTMADDHGMRRP